MIINALNTMKSILTEVCGRRVLFDGLSIDITHKEAPRTENVWLMWEHRWSLGFLVAYLQFLLLLFWQEISFEGPSITLHPPPHT